MKKVVAKHRYRGTEYVLAEIIKYAPQICLVSTERAYPQTWFIKTVDIKFLGEPHE